MKHLVALAAMLAVSALACAAEGSPETAAGSGLVMEKYTKPGSAIVYRRMVERKAVAEVSPPAAQAPTSLAPAAMETYTKPGSAIVYHRPVVGGVTTASAE